MQWKKYATAKEHEPTEKQIVSGIVGRRRGHRRRRRIVSRRYNFRRRIIVIRQQ